MHGARHVETSTLTSRSVDLVELTAVVMSLSTSDLTPDPTRTQMQSDPPRLRHTASPEAATERAEADVGAG